MCAARRSHVDVLLEVLSFGSAMGAMAVAYWRHNVTGAFQCFGSSGDVLRKPLWQATMARLAFLQSIVAFICAHRAFGGDGRVSQHDVIDIRMEAPTWGSLGMFSEGSLPKANTRAVGGVPVPEEYASILQRQQRQTAEVFALYSEAMSFNTRVAAR